MMSALEGGHGEADVVRGVAWIVYYTSADKGEGLKKSENFADVINGCSLSQSAQRPTATRPRRTREAAKKASPPKEKEAESDNQARGGRERDSSRV